MNIPDAYGARHQETEDISLADVRAFDRQTRVFRNYGIPIIGMKAGTSPAPVVQTFERINTQGLELGIFGSVEILQG
jgi:hypothetical protein